MENNHRVLREASVRSTRGKQTQRHSPILSVRLPGQRSALKVPGSRLGRCAYRQSRQSPLGRPCLLSRESKVSCCLKRKSTSQGNQSPAPASIWIRNGLGKEGLKELSGGKCCRLQDHGLEHTKPWVLVLAQGRGRYSG